MFRWARWVSNSLKLALLAFCLAFNLPISDASAENLNDDIKEIQSPVFLKELRNWEYYNFVGKGKVKFSNKVIKEYKKFKNHGNGSWFLVTENGKNPYWRWCRGNHGCSKHSGKGILIEKFTVLQ